MRAMRIQPQGSAKLNRRNKFAANAQAILAASHSINLATGKPLTPGQSGYARAGQPAGLSWSFRKNFYIQTETLPAIGTASFVEFWYGYTSADQGNRGGGSSDPTFLTGSPTTGIAIVSRLGNRRPEGYWGAIYNWGNSYFDQFNSAGEVLSYGALTLLVVVRRQTGMEFWRDGKMVAFIPQAPISIAATPMLLGSFVDDIYWTSSSDALLAGRVLTPTEPTADEIRQFSANPWQIFEGANEEEFVATATPGVVDTPLAPDTALLSVAGYAPTVARGVTSSVLPGAGTLSVTGYAPSITQGVTNSLLTAPVALTIAGYAPSVTQGLTKIVSPAPASLAVAGYAPTVSQTASRAASPTPVGLAITGYSPTVTRGASLTVTAAVPAALAVTGYAPTITQASNAAPHMYDVTSMRLSVVRSVVDLGPDRIQQITGFP